MQSTLILSRESGAVVHTSGLIAEGRSADSNGGLPFSIDSAPDTYTAERNDTAQSMVENVAGLVSAFVDASGVMINGLNPDDDLRLLRVRTMKNELVIVPSKRSQNAVNVRGARC